MDVQDGNDMLMKSASELFQFGEVMDEHYDGVRFVRGRRADVWSSSQHEVPQPGRAGGPDRLLTITRTHYFSTDDWSSQGSNAAVPLMMEVEGTSYPVDDDGQKIESEGYYFHHQYHMVDFWSGPLATAGLISPAFGHHELNEIPW